MDTYSGLPCHFEMLYFITNKIVKLGINKYLLAFCISVFLSGCATVSSISRNYKNIDLSDGISRQEAKVIAQKQIIQTDFKKDYRIINPSIYHAEEFTDDLKERFLRDKAIYDSGQLRYPNSWHIIFHPKWLSLFSLYYLVVVDKDSGEVQYEHAENAIVALGEILFSEFLNNSLQPAFLAVGYYSEKGYWPSTGEALQKYFEEKIVQENPDKTEPLKINFEGLQFEQTQEGNLLIQNKDEQDIPLLSSLFCEIEESNDDKFIVRYKSSNKQGDHISKFFEGEIAVSVNIQDNKVEILPIRKVPGTKR